MPLTIGQTLQNRYRILGLLGQGGMGAVYLAEDLRLPGRRCAIKENVLDPHASPQVLAQLRQQFLAEASILSRLDHPNLTKVSDYFTQGGNEYLVMDFVEGENLQSVLDRWLRQYRQPLPEASVLPWFDQVLDALEYLHGQQPYAILHRDIKPGNIMVNEEGQVKVTDFGLARPITGEAEENPYGTPDYAAPEILEKKGVDQRADIFAAGVVLYEMLTGRVPQHPRRSVTEYAPLSSRWDELIAKATHSDPAQRFQDARDFRAHIMLLVNQAAQATAVPVAVPVDEAEQAAASATSPSRRLLILAAAAVLCLGVLMAVLLRSEQEPAPKGISRKPSAQTNRTAEAEEKFSPRKKPKRVGIRDKEKSEPANAAPTVPEKAAPTPPAAKEMATAPTPSPAPVTPEMPQPATAPPPPKVTARDLIQRLEELDPDLVQLVTKFADEWATNSDIGTESRIDDLNAKYIPALQRSLNGLKPEQRDHILSEISHIANREPLNEPAPSWPPALENLRKTYRTQESAIQTAASEAARRLRENQCNTMLAEARKRAEAGKKEAAELAEAVAAELAKLTEPPSLPALKKSAAGKSNGGVSEADALR